MSTFKAPRHSNRSWTIAQAMKQFNSLRIVDNATIANNGRVLLTVTGSGNIIDVLDANKQSVQTYANDGTLLQKKIFNTDTRAISGLQNPETKWHFNEGVKAEQAGNAQLASDHLQEWLNRCTLSFSVLSTTKEFNDIVKGDQVAANLETIVTENGKMVGVSSKNLAVKAVNAGKTTESTLEQLMAQFSMVDDSATAETETATTEKPVTAEATA